MEKVRKEKMKKGFYLKLKAAVIASAMLCVGIYALCLKEIPFYGLSRLWFREDQWQVYLGELAVMAAFGGLLFCSRTLMQKSPDRRRRIFILTCGLLIFAAVLYDIVLDNGSLWKWRIRSIIVSLWPFGAYFLARRVQKGTEEGNGRVRFLREGVYYLLMVIAVFIAEYVMVDYESYRGEPLETFYLFAVSVMIRNMAQGDREHSDRVPVESLLFPAVSFLLVFSQNSRVKEIISSLANPVASVDGNVSGTNWLGYRMALLSGGFRGDFSLMEKPFAGRVASCPLVWIKYVKGAAVCFFVVALEAFLLYALVSLAKKRRCERGTKPLPLVLVAALLIRSALGLFADMFLITSTDVGVLLLRNPGDILIILYFVFTINIADAENDYAECQTEKTAAFGLLQAGKQGK